MDPFTAPIRCRDEVSGAVVPAASRPLISRGERRI